MLAAWIAYTVVVSALVGLAALAVERALVLAGRPLRWVWTAAVPVSLALVVGPPIGALIGSGGPMTGVTDSFEPSAGVVPLLGIPATIDVPADGILARLDVPLAWAWGAGAAGLLAWSAGAAISLRRRRRRWTRIRFRGEEVLVSTDAGPALLGVLSTRVVLPRWCLELPPRSVELVLAHEAAHREAGDTRVVGAVAAVAALLPWNLPFWWMLGRLRLAVELDCDARVLERFPERRRLYGELLLDVCSRKGALAGVPAAFSEHRATLPRRIEMLTRKLETPPLRRILTFTVAGGLVIAAACLVPGPDRDVPGLTGPEDDPTAAVVAAEEGPRFTPYEVPPDVLNAAEIRTALQQEYPSLLRDAGIGGVVVLYFFIDEQGVVRNAVVNQSSGHDALDRAAERVAFAFRFTPAFNRGEPVPVWVSIPIRFEVPQGEG